MRTVLIPILFAAAVGHAANPSRLAQPPQVYSFEENLGQVHNPEVRYTAHGRGYQLFLTPREAVLSIRDNSVLRMSLMKSRRHPVVEALDRSETRSHYLVGAPSGWREDIPHWNRVRYRGVYPGIDMIYYGRNGELEYDFIVAPGSLPSTIDLKMAGAGSFEILPNGDLRMGVKDGVFTLKAPKAYQEWGGERHTIGVRYQLRPDHRVGFQVGAYNSSLPLVIDPLLVFSTYLGGERTDEVTSITVDKDGNTYLAGETTSGDFPTVDPFLKKPTASVHAFITKINAAGNKILYSTFVGGDGNTRINSIALDADGNICVAGRTGARDFPLKNPVQDKQTGLNIVFVTKLTAQGDKLLFSTYLGGERNDEAYGLALDDAGDIFIAGIANSAQFPTVNALNAKAPGGGDGFIVKFAAPDYRIAYSTYFGGPANDEIHALAVDGAGNAYVTGLTYSSNLGTTDAYQPKLKSQDAFVGMLTADGSQVGFFTYLGGTGYERGRAIKVAADGTIWVGGYATSANFPVTDNAFQPKMAGDSDAFLSHLSADGQRLLYSTFLGGTKSAGVGGEEATSIALDVEGAVFVTGITMSPDFPAVRKIQDFGGGKQDAFLVKFAPEGDHVVFSTLLGGSADEMSEAVAVDPQGGVYVGGQTASTDYPMKGGVRSKVAGSNEGFLTKVCDPYLWVSQPELRFVYSLGQAAPALQAVQISTCAPIPFNVESADFVSANPSTGMTNASFDVRVDPGSLAVGEYKSTIRISAPDAVNDGLLIPVTLVVIPPPPAISIDEVGNVFPGMALEIHGTNLGPVDAVEFPDGDADGLSGTGVFFDEIAAKVVFTSVRVVRVIVPDGVAGRTETVLLLQYKGQRSNAIKLQVAQNLNERRKK